MLAARVPPRPRPQAHRLRPQTRRRAPKRLATRPRQFGTGDIALILARMTQGLHRPAHLKNGLSAKPTLGTHRPGLERRRPRAHRAAPRTPHRPVTPTIRISRACPRPSRSQSGMPPSLTRWPPADRSAASLLTSAEPSVMAGTERGHPATRRQPRHPAEGHPRPGDPRLFPALGRRLATPGATSAKPVPHWRRPALTLRA